MARHSYEPPTLELWFQMHYEVSANENTIPAKTIYKLYWELTMENHGLCGEPYLDLKKRQGLSSLLV